MRAEAAVRYLEGEIAFHLRHHFRPEALAAWRALRLRWAPYGELADARDDVAIPTDLAAPAAVGDAWTVAFAGTRLTLWNRVPRPDGWRGVPNDDRPLWYERGATRMPAWNLFGNLVRLLTLAEETAVGARDRHGRFVGAMSPRDAPGLLAVPAFNEAVAALAGVALWRQSGSREGHEAIGGALEPPGVALSHDVDLLRGDDVVTQAVRAVRFARPLLRARRPDWNAGRAIVVNALSPRRHYLETISRLVELERAAGARSSFYFLNGTGGRFGARSGATDIPAARAAVPDGWNLGMHYNYDTLACAEAFRRQRKELERLLGRAVDGGRAHYLRFDPARSFVFLESQGLRYDESLGYPDRIGYRSGVAGAFHAPDGAAGEARRLVEIPLAVMDGTLADRHPGQGLAVVERLLGHLARIGGTLSILVHPGVFGNPELEDPATPYDALLAAARRLRARFLLPADFLDS